MRRALTGLALMLFTSGCLDFTVAKLVCFDAGSCKLPASDPPSVVSTSPSSGKVDAGINDPITITFSREMDRATVELQLTPPDGLTAAEWDSLGTQALFVPAAPLRHATTYTARVNGAAASDHAALPEHTFNFTTSAPPDSTPPTLTGSIPVNGANAVALGATLQLDFSEVIDQASLTVISNPPRDFGAATWMGNGMTVRFLAPPMPFEPLTDYTLAVDARDTAGNPLAGSGTIIFTTTAPPDSTPPTVVSMSPPSGSMMISPAANVNVSLSFSEPVKPMASQALTVTPAISGLACTLDVAGVLMTCSHPATPLAMSTLYTVTLRAMATLADGGMPRSEDLAGNRLASDFVGTFTTGAVPDTTPPTVVSFTPDAGALGLPYYPAMRVTFSEPMDKAATQSALVVSSPNAVTGTYSWDVSGRTVTLTPTAPQGGFAHGTSFAWQVGTGARDLAGNALAVTQQYTFRVRRQVSSTMTSLAADGYHREVGATRTATATATYGYVGDNSSNDAFKSYLYFDFAAANGIPTNVLGIVTAQLFIDISGRVGDPKGSLGGALTASSISWVSPFGTTQWTAAPYSLPNCMFVFCLTPGLFLDDSVGRRSTYVTAHVTQALPSRHIMFRLSYPNDEDNQSDYDYVTVLMSETASSSDRPQLQVVYEVP